MRKKGFTLIELLVVIAIIAIIAAIVFPVFNRAKAKAKQTACLSNLKQIGTAFALYMPDYDDLFPNGADAVDKEQPGIWDEIPGFREQVEAMPPMHELLQPYVKNKEVFRSPADSGMYVLDDRPQIPLLGVPSVYQRFGNSYFYRTELTLRRKTGTSLPNISGTNMMETASGAWHSSTRQLREPVPFDEWKATVDKYRYNVLFADTHARSLDFWQLREAWSVPVE